MTTLFDTVHMGDLELKNRIVMAPLTRSRASAEGVHGDLAKTYYTQRAGAGLIITEATAVSKQGSGYPHIPGIWNDQQVAGWRAITNSVHAHKGKIFLQMFHTGRVGHSSLMGEQPVSSTDTPPEGEVMAADFSMKAYENPRKLKTEEIPGIVQQFVTGAENAKKAGFDGVEIHGANGYLMDQFLRDGVNQRNDEYGGDMIKRMRFLKEIVAGAVKVWGSDKVAVRLSPYNKFNTMSDSNPFAHFSAIAQMLNEFPLAYLHIMEPIGKHPFGADNTLPRFSDEARKIFKGRLMINGGLSQKLAEDLLSKNKADLFAFGVPYIANPDLAERMQSNLALNEADPSTFYAGGAKGYIDYPMATEKAA